MYSSVVLTLGSKEEFIAVAWSLLESGVEECCVRPKPAFLQHRLKLTQGKVASIAWNCTWSSMPLLSWCWLIALGRWIGRGFSMWCMQPFLMKGYKAGCVSCWVSGQPPEQQCHNNWASGQRQIINHWVLNRVAPRSRVEGCGPRIHTRLEIKYCRSIPGGVPDTGGLRLRK